MKTERRHELQTNQLADSLAHWIEAVKPYSRALLALLVAAVVLIFAWGYMSSQSSRRAADGWNEYFDAFTSRDPRDALAEVSERYAGTPVGDWSRLALADLQLDDGTNRLFIDKRDGRDELKLAIDKYETILHVSQQPLVLQRATFGLARAREALGSLDEARKQYNALVEKWPKSAFAAAAEQRAKDLERESTKGFYDWFAKYEPPKPLTKEPGTPGVRPDFLNDALDNNSLKLPSVIDDKVPLPKLGTEPPAGDAAPPGEDKKADEAKPTTDPPAETPPQPEDKKPAETAP